MFYLVTQYSLFNIQVNRSIFRILEHRLNFDFQLTGSDNFSITHAFQSQRNSKRFSVLLDYCSTLVYSCSGISDFKRKLLHSTIFSREKTWPEKSQHLPSPLYWPRFIVSYERLPEMSTDKCCKSSFRCPCKHPSVLNLYSNVFD